MMVEQHTQGPWSSFLGAHGSKIVIHGPKGAGEYVCAVQLLNGSTDPVQWLDERRRADARLIAAAPELLEALKNITGWMEVMEHLHGELKGGAKQSIEDATAAIRKATEAAS